MDPSDLDPAHLDPARLDPARLDPDRRRELVTAWLDGELGPAEARAVEAWLAAHPGEAREVEALRKTWDLLGAYPDEPVPEGFAERVLETAGVRSPPARARVLRLVLGWKSLAAAAALVLAVGAGVRLLGRDGTPPADAPAEATALLESVPPDVLEQADVLLSLSEDEFSALLEMDPDEVASGPQGG